MSSVRGGFYVVEHGDEFLGVVNALAHLFRGHAVVVEVCVKSVRY